MSDGDGNGGLTPKMGLRRPIRLLEIIGNAITGGMETYTRNLIASLPRDEYDITCILPFESAYTASLRELGCRVYITPIHDDPLWRSIEMATEVIRQHQIDVIHANLANAHTLAGVVGRLTNTPAVATLHSRTLWIQELSVTRLTGMNLITVCQEAYWQALATGLPPERVSLIRNGVDTARFAPSRSGAAFRASLGLGADVQLVGFVGRMSWEKGPDKFVHAASRIRQQLPDVHFAMVGEGHVEPDIRHIIEETGMGDRVHMVGLRRDVENVYPAFDLLIQTSRSEAMPLALLEGMASGVPVVALAVGGVAELVGGGTTGALINPGDWPGVASHYPGDTEGIALAAADLLRNPVRLKEMGAAARARVESQFDLRGSVAETSALFERLVKPAVMKNGAWQQLPQVVRDKGDGERRVRLKTQNGGLDRAGLAAVRSVES
jgi:glycosyltransferase involved in cell wall biosynthesis